MSEEAVFAKCARRLIPFIFILYLVNFIDRVNVGFAAITMNGDLGFSPAIFGWGGSIFFAGYSLFQVPANLILAKVGARRWMFLLLLVWGAISSCNALIQTPMQFYVMRFLLGIAEAGFFPGMVLYLTYWFPKSYRARFVALFMVAIPFSNIVGAPLSGAILGMDGIAGLKGWQWMFILEGLPACLLAFVVLRFLPSGPREASWLAADEQSLIQQRVAAEDTAQHQDFGAAMLDIRVYALGIIYLGYATAFYGVQLWLPQIVKGMGFSTIMTGFMVAIPFIIAMVAMIFWGQSSDRSGERIWHVALPMLFSAIGLIAAATFSGSNVVVFLSLTVVLMGVMSFQGPFWTLPPAILGGSAAAGGIAFINTIGTGGGGFVGPNIVGQLVQAYGGYSVAMAVLAVAPALSAIIVVALKNSVATEPALT